MAIANWNYDVIRSEALDAAQSLSSIFVTSLISSQSQDACILKIPLIISLITESFPASETEKTW